jgi:uncharacterized protein YndB with AHSA1/START domain
MPFEHSRTVTTSAPAEAVWALWSDPGTWPTWDPAVEDVQIDGAFEAGARGTMTLTGGIEAPVLLETVERGSRYVDELTVGELTIRIDHVVTATESGAEITVSTRVTGPGADDVGPVVVADAPRALAALVAQAEAQRG